MLMRLMKYVIGSVCSFVIMIGLTVLVFLITAADADYDEYWYTTDEGVLDGQTVNIDKLWNENLTKYLRVNNIYQSKNRQVLSRQSAMKELSRLTTFQLKPGVDAFKRMVFPMPEGEKYCVAGQTATIGCNQCHCIAGQMYLCTSIICAQNIIIYPLSHRCKEGRKRRLKDGCNFCICRGGQEYCTEKKCVIIGKQKLSLPSSCKEKAIISRYQGCNTCVCLGGKYYCTKVKCGGKEDRELPKRLLHKSSCINNKKRLLDDGCNYCICRKGEEVCSMIPCPANERVQQLYYLKAQCVEGEEPPALDDCNKCYCVNEQILCTIHKCDHARSKKYLHRRSIPTCNEGQVYKTACEICVCANGEVTCLDICRTATNEVENSGHLSKECEDDFTEISSDDCSKCMCLNGQKYCTKMNCLANGTVVDATDCRKSTNSNGNRQLKECGDDFKETSSDDCNACVCFNGKKFCTIMHCLTNVTDVDASESRTRRQLVKRSVPPCTEGHVYESICESCTCKNEQLVCIDTCSKEPNRRRNKRQINECGDDFTGVSSDDCNSCVCLNGKKLCTKMKCLTNVTDVAASESLLHRRRIRIKAGKNHRNHLNLNQNVCGEDFVEVPSDDCNVCMCLNGQKLCTHANCKSNSTTQSPKEEFCTLGSFYSPDRNRFCRSCMCLPNGVSICFLNMCKYSKDNSHYKEPAPGKECVQGEVVKPGSCTTCRCQSNLKWLCLRKRGCTAPECVNGDDFQIGTDKLCTGCKCQDNQWFCGVSQHSCPATEKCSPAGTFIRSQFRPCSVCVCKPKESNLCFTDVACARKAVVDIMAKK